MRLSLATLTLIAVSLATITGCSTANLTVKSDYDKRVNFKRFRTFAWNPAGNQVITVEPGRAVNAHQFIKGTVEREFPRKGLKRTSFNAADLLVGFRVNARQRTKVTKWEKVKLFGEETNVAVEKKTYREGVIVLEAIDNATGKLVWYGEVAGTFVDPDAAKSSVYNAIERMVKRYPR